MAIMLRLSKLSLIRASNIDEGLNVVPRHSNHHHNNLINIREANHLEMSTKKFEDFVKVMSSLCQSESLTGFTIMKFFLAGNPQEEIQANHERKRRESQFRSEKRCNNLFCGMDEWTLANTLNIDTKRADIYNPQAGRISIVNNYNLPILSHLRLNIDHCFLYMNGIYATHWNINAHNIIYVTRGSSRCQFVDNNRQQVFNGQLQEGQLLVVPQN
ncbi:hypothetical protein ACFE04_004500 [Oxalis oulophora]